MNLTLNKALLNYKGVAFLVFFVFCFFSNLTVFSQTVSTDISNEVLIIEGSTKTDETTVKESTQNLNSNVGFILWFMGTKEDPNKTMSQDSNTKKFILTSGTEPNRLLIKTLLKKTVNLKFC